MKLTIFGATGGTGRLLVLQALEEGFHVTALVRDPLKMKITHPRLRIVQGNVSDYLAVRRVLKHADAVISTLGAQSPFFFDQTIVDGIGHIIKGMQEEGIGRFIYMSFIGVASSRSRAGGMIRLLAPTLLRTETRGHAIRERMIGECGLYWTIVQAPTLTNGRATGVYRTGDAIQSKSFFSSIPRADVASFILHELMAGAYIKRSVAILK